MSLGDLVAGSRIDVHAILVDADMRRDSSEYHAHFATSIPTTACAAFLASSAMTFASSSGVNDT